MGAYSAWSAGGDVLTGTLIGAVGGAVGNFAVSGLGTTVAVGFTSGVVGSLAGPISSGQPITPSGLLFSGLLGGLAAPLGPAFSAVMGKGGAGAAVGGTMTGILDIVNTSEEGRRGKPVSCPRQ